ncbi:MAG: HAMP domain-containing protein [Betaproteobacteria bacterium]|nr:HAMP domain-containing protein [Betaproteobacteria bacterium]
MAFPTLKIATKLPLIIISAALIAALIIGVNSYQTTSGLLTKAANEKLTALMISRKTALTQYLSSIREDLLVTASSGAVITAMNAFGRDFATIANAGDPVAQLQKIYIKDNPNKLGEKHKLITASDGSAYSKTHGQLHPWFKKFLEARGYYDVFLVDLSGNVVYSVFKELDFATNLNKGEWKDSDLGNVFRKTKTAAKDSVAFFDFKPYAPSANAPASFIATPIVGAAGKNIGSLVFQMPVDRINTIMQVAAGMGKSGETYIVGKDFLMRSNSRFSKEPTILKTKVDTATVKKALANKSGIEVTPDYRGIPVFSAYTPMAFEKTPFAIMAEIDESEVLGPVRSMAKSLLIAGVIMAIIISLLGVFFARRISRPIDSMTTAMGSLAEGNLETEIPALDRTDEIGSMAKAVEIFKTNAIQVKKMEAEQVEQAQEAEVEKKAAMDQMADNLEETVGASMKTIIDRSNNILEIASGMGGSINKTASGSLQVAEASMATSQDVEAVAAATTELSSSIQEISQQVATSSQIATSAVNEANEVNAKIQGLNVAAQKIGEVVSMITDIAEQTNLLALNATIEAARAGDAGKGFAVVASEVKNLASQTAKATDEIDQQIGKIQAETRESVVAIESITKTITNIDEVVTSISAAVEEQGAATSEIAHTVERVNGSARVVADRIAGVTLNSAQSYGSSIKVLWAATDLDAPTKVMQTDLSEFLGNVRG